MTDMRRTQVLLDEVTYQTLKDEARDRDISMSEVLRQLVRDYLAPRSKRTYRRATDLPFVNLGNSGQKPGDKLYPISVNHDEALAEDFAHRSSLIRLPFTAAADAGDPYHQAAIDALNRVPAEGEELLVHNYVLLEVAALLQRRLGVSFALEALEESGQYRIHWITSRDHNAAVALLRERGRRGLSLVDCASFVVMRRYRLTQALAFDSDFRVRGLHSIWDASRFLMEVERDLDDRRVRAFDEVVL
jgi:uncharacterized protein